MSVKRRYLFWNLMTLFAFTAGSPLAWGDAVVIVGTFLRTNPINGKAATDKAFQIHSVCQAIQGAQALGHEVVLLTPTITCGGKEIKGRCAKGGECLPAEIQRELTSLSSRIPEAGKQNILIQTVGHGSPKTSYSWEKDQGPWDNRLRIGDGNLSAKEFADLVNRSGLARKAKQIRGLWTQCYSGGWNEMANLLKPEGKFCSIAEAPHNQTADISKAEVEKLGGAGFVQGFWDTQRASKGNASLHESIVHAAHTQKAASGGATSSHKWNPSSAYLAEKATNTGPFYKRSSETSPASAPSAYFANGYDIEHLGIYQAFVRASQSTKKETQEIRERYKTHVSEVAIYNKEKWFFQDAKNVSGSYLYRSQSCHQAFQGPLGEAAQDLVRSIAGLRSKIETEEYRAVRTTLQKKLDEWEKERIASEKLLPPEIKTYHERNNALLLESGELMRKIKLGEIPWETRKKLSEEYDALSKKFTALAQLKDFPQLRKQLVIEKQVRQFEALIRVIEDQNLSTETKDRILTAWECENTSVFAPKGVGP